MIMRSLLFPFRSAAQKGGREGRKKKNPSSVRWPATGNTMTRARPALGEGLGEPVWELRPGLATFTQRPRPAHARLLIFMRGVSWRDTPLPSGLMGRGSTGRNLEGLRGSGTRRTSSTSRGPVQTPALGSCGARREGREDAGRNLEVSVAQGRAGPTRADLPPRAPQAARLCPPVGAPGVGAATLPERSERGSFRLPSRLRQLRLSPQEGLPAGSPARFPRAS